MCWIHNGDLEPDRKGTLSICLQLMNADIKLYQPLDYKPLSAASSELLQCAIEYYTNGKRVIMPTRLDADLNALYDELVRRAAETETT